MTRRDLSYSDILERIKTYNDPTVQELRNKPCRDNDQAQRIETYIHQTFHELYSITPDITHGVNMSCSRDHKLVPTLWITKFTLKNPPASAGTTKNDAAKSGAAPLG
jgi:hypothetical protein